MAPRLLMAILVLMAWSAPIQSVPRGKYNRGHHNRAPGSGCELAMQPIPGMNPIVRTDSNGRSCRGNITTQVCVGFCETFEMRSENDVLL
uniref:Glycoprotein hormone subunit beta domain-containing protein n=1 Tax=Plectus sambesii TaxID=2011161 RepID=A0A914WCB4_9BILA